MPYETPNGCIYDSGDYAQMLDIATELIGWRHLEEKRLDAAARGKLLGVGIGSTLDSGTNNFGQSRMINPELQFSGNNEVATVKLDIFGEIVVTLGTTPQGQGHETTAAQVVADILGCAIDDVHVRAGHDSYWNSHAGFSGTYASQFAVTGLSAVKGATDMLAEQIKRLGSVILGGVPVEALELADGTVRIKDNPEAALPFMACGAIINANNAGLPEDLDVTLNCRYVYRPPFEVPDVERKFGNLTLTYAAQVHAAVVEIDPETGYYEIVDYAAVDDCGTRINPQIVEGQVMGATAQALGGVDARDLRVRRRREPPDAELLRLPRSARARHAAAARRATSRARRRSPRSARRAWAKAAARGSTRCAPRSRTRCAGNGDAIVWDSSNPYRRVWEMLSSPEQRGRPRRGGRRMNVEGERVFDAPRATVWQVLNDPASMAATMPGVESFDVHDDQSLDGEREDPARARRSEDEDRHEQDRGARARVRRDADQGPGRRRDDEHGDEVRPQRRGRRGTKMKWSADVKIAGPVGSMGQRVLQPIVNQQVQHVLGALDQQVQDARAGAKA